MAGEQFFTRGPDAALAEITVEDGAGVAASLSFKFFDRGLGRGELEAEGRLAPAIQMMLMDDTTVWTPRNGIVRNRPDLYTYVIGRLRIARQKGEYGIKAIQFSGEGMTTPTGLDDEVAF